MPLIEDEGIKVEIDDEGYLTNFDDWDEKVACVLAKREGLECPLTKEQMEILRFMRDYYKQYDSFPVVRSICKNVGQEKGCVYLEFPDPIKAWKIAGLPKPTARVFALVRHEIS